MYTATDQRVGPCNQGPGKQPGHLPLPLLSSKVEEELSSSAHTYTLLPALAESWTLECGKNELPFLIALHSYLYTIATYSKVLPVMANNFYHYLNISGLES